MFIPSSSLQQELAASANSIDVALERPVDGTLAMAKEL